MLVLSRRKDTSIIVGEDVEIKVLDIQGNKVRLGVTAPTTIKVHRREVYEAIQQQKMNEKTDK
jgi:carbon storage regulator